MSSKEINEDDIPFIDGKALCPMCKSWILCGPGGIKNLPGHVGSKKCLDTKSKRDKAVPRMKDTSILSFLTKRAAPVPALVPSQTQEPPNTIPLAVPVILASETDSGGNGSGHDGLDVRLEETWNIEEQFVNKPDTPIVHRPETIKSFTNTITFYKTSLANRFQELVDNLPPDTSTKDSPDILSMFACDPASFDNGYVADEDLWEEILNPLLKGVFGWGNELDVRRVLDGKRDGLQGLPAFVEYFVQRRRVSEGLFEGKLAHLMDGLQVSKLQTERINFDAPTLPIDDGAPDEPILATIKPRLQRSTLSKAKSESTPIQCVGYRLDFPPGLSPHTAYPFALHASQPIPWSYSVVNDEMRLYSKNCQKTLTKTTGQHESVCPECRNLVQHTTLVGIKKRIEDGVNRNTPYAYRSIGHLLATLKQKDTLIDSLRLRGLNQARTLLNRSTTLSEHKRFLIAISSARYGNVERIIRLGLKQHRSIGSIAASYESAAKGLYKPKSYTEEEEMKGLLLFKLGGSRVAGIAHRALGLPAVSTLRTRVLMPPLVPSHAAPTIKEVMANILACLESIEALLGIGTIIHLVGMFDEIATEKRVRWDDLTNHFLGLCREHGWKTSLDFNSVEDLEELFRSLEQKEVHYAAEATVGALGILSGDSRIYAARPVLISGDCKREKAEEHLSVLQTVLTAVNMTKAPRKHRVVCVASDGETRRGAALALLTFKTRLSPSSPIYDLLSPLRLMDFHVGDDDLTADKDWKHVFKRFRNLLLRSRGVLVLGIRITPAIIQSHLKSSGHTAAHIHALFNPDDEQDVKLAFDLLKAIWSLPPLPDHQNPSVVESRIALRTLGKMLYHMVLPYLCVDLSLSEQLEHLSAAAHLSLILYHSAGKAFIPTLLYVDLMIMIKNVFFCVAKARIDNPSSSFFLILLGTDRLEELFGVLRTMIGNDANLDIWQLASRVTATTQISNILAKYPHWDRPPRRLKLPAITRDSVELPDTSDHIKPASWKGDVRVQYITLQTSWNRGRRLVEEECDFARGAFSSMERNNQITILAPNGKLLVGVPLFEDEDESQELIQPTHSIDPSDFQSVPIPQENLTSTQAEIEDEIMDSVDLEHPSSPSAPPANSEILPPKFGRFVVYNGKHLLKSRALALRSRSMGKIAPSSTDRLKRVQEVERYGKGSSSLSINDSEETSPGDVISIQDPVGTLVRCDGHILLCIGEVNNIRIDSQSVSSVSLISIAESDPDKISISLSVLGLRRATVEDDPSCQSDWRSYRLSFERTIHVSAKVVAPVNPIISAQGIGKVFYLLEGKFLVTLAASIFGSLEKSDLKKLSIIAPSNEFPYIESTGKACFAISSPHLDDIGGTLNACPLCEPEFELAGKGGPRNLEHMAAHILFDPKVIREHQPCGLCLRSAPQCLFILAKRDGHPNRINWKTSIGCQNPIHFQYANAEKSTTASPCSNVPLNCPLCPLKSPAVWRYNLKYHIMEQHPNTPRDRYRDLCEISDTEVNALRTVWKNRGGTTSKRGNESSKKRIIISDAHSTVATFKGALDSELNNEISSESESESVSESSTFEGTAPQARGKEGEEAITTDADVPDLRFYAHDTLDLHLDIQHDSHEGVSMESEAELAQDSEILINDEPALPLPDPSQTVQLEPANGDVHEEATSESSGLRPRKRGRINVQDLANCICGQSAFPTENDSTDTTRVKCKHKTCETSWYHCECVNLSFVPRNWVCEACLGDRNRKRSRGQ